MRKHLIDVVSEGKIPKGTVLTTLWVIELFLQTWWSLEMQQNSDRTNDFFWSGYLKSICWGRTFTLHENSANIVKIYITNKFNLISDSQGTFKFIDTVIPNDINKICVHRKESGLKPFSRCLNDTESLDNKNDSDDDSDNNCRWWWWCLKWWFRFLG